MVSSIAALPSLILLGRTLKPRLIIFMQLKPRISSWRGIFELGMNLFQGGLAWTPLYSEGLGLLFDSDSCEDLGTAFGKSVRYGLIYEAPDAVFYNDVITNAATYINN